MKCFKKDFIIFIHFQILNFNRDVCVASWEVLTRPAWKPRLGQLWGVESRLDNLGGELEELGG